MKQREARRYDCILVGGRVTRCGSNCSTFINLHQAASGCWLHKGTTVESWWLLDSDDYIVLGVLHKKLSNPFVCKQVLFSFTTSDKHTQTFTLLKIVWLWMQMRKRSEEKNTLNSALSFTTHKALMSSQQCTALCLFLNFSVLHVSKASKCLESWWEAAERGQCNILSLTTLDNREVFWVPFGPGTLRVAHPSFSRAEQCRGPTKVMRYTNIRSPTSCTFWGCVQHYEEFSSDRK